MVPIDYGFQKILLDESTILLIFKLVADNKHPMGIVPIQSPLLSLKVDMVKAEYSVSQLNLPL